MVQEVLLHRASTAASPLNIGFTESEVETNSRDCYQVILKRGFDGWIIAKCIDVRGAVSQGKNVQEALSNIIEAISVILEDTYGEVREFSILVREET
ncbi:MAG: type II toxin-antitoxin system HicB family antitoxin [Candidatus Odinarchaeum yellowstonii]|jgi:predicted RNase H-like HicB family nuclease|uniref:Type II toxin-antitoxin system HicB family antitoxin n=1 Tax=Odinarchaeota yellowstonii (strain LCB_4) TaxID=1841599 RepID=A0AAF0IAP0_ODILC|nr:MAG: type II toxin-antitoxin system HicB family antitoxin [Candidatus Odinarchaeum yellowstonii]